VGDDEPAITALRLALLAEEARSPLFAHPHPRAAGRARQLSATQVAARNEAVLLALAGTHPVGMLRCSIARGFPLVRDARHAVLTSAYVRPEYRRKGVLRALLSAADEWCRARRLGEMRLRCTVENAGGNAAWESLGFAPAEIVHRRPVPRS
jgi:GNAT superfamily N-acetyltransferase